MDSPAASVVSRLPGLLRKASSRPSEDVVHRLRTTIRRIETTLNGTSSSDSTKLRKQFKKIRKRAGTLRDIDVQLALLESLHRRHDRDAIEVENTLQHTRERQERKIRKLVDGELESGILKRMRSVAAGPDRTNLSPEVDLAGIANEFVENLRGVEISEENLHGFRTLTKKLRYRAELAPESASRSALITELKRVQDLVGIWHDGMLLSETATFVLGDSKRNSLLSILRTHNHSRYLEAIRAVEHARTAVPAIFTAPPARKPSQSAHSVHAKSRPAIA